MKLSGSFAKKFNQETVLSLCSENKNKKKTSEKSEKCCKMAWLVENNRLTLLLNYLFIRKIGLSVNYRIRKGRGKIFLSCNGKFIS